MNALTLVLAACMLAQGTLAVSWRQFSGAGCTGTVTNSGDASPTRQTGTGAPDVCVPQNGDSVDFASSDGRHCSLFIFNDPNCDQFAFDIGDGCYNWGSGGHAFGISNCQ